MLPDLRLSWSAAKGPKPSKLVMRVRFPSPALLFRRRSGAVPSLPVRVGPSNRGPFVPHTCHSDAESGALFPAFWLARTGPLLPRLDQVKSWLENLERLSVVQALRDHGAEYSRERMTRNAQPVSPSPVLAGLVDQALANVEHDRANHGSNTTAPSAWATETKPSCRQSARCAKRRDRTRGRDSCLVRCLVRALPNSAVFDQGGACGAAGPASAPGLKPWGPARAHAGPHARGGQIRRSYANAVTGAAQCHLPRLRLSSSRPPRLDRSLRSRRRRSALPNLDPAATHQGWAPTRKIGEVQSWPSGPYATTNAGPRDSGATARLPGTREENPR